MKLLGSPALWELMKRGMLAVPLGDHKEEKRYHRVTCPRPYSSSEPCVTDLKIPCTCEVWSVHTKYIYFTLFMV